MAWEQTVGPESHEFKIELPNTRAAASHARKQLVRFVEHFRIKREVISDIETAAGEALANAAEHGYRRHGKIRVEARVSEFCFEAIVSDDGPGFAGRPVALDHPEALALRGYGLFMIQTLVDAFEFRDDGRTVWFQKRF